MARQYRNALNFCRKNHRTIIKSAAQITRCRIIKTLLGTVFILPERCATSQSIPPNASSGNPFDYLPRFRQMAEEADRDPQSLEVTLGGAPEDPDMLKRYRDLGVSRVNFPVPPAKADEVLPILDRIASCPETILSRRISLPAWEKAWLAARSVAGVRGTAPRSGVVL